MRKIDNGKKILEAAVAIIVVLALILPSSTVIADTSRSSVEKQMTLTIWLPGITPNDYKKQVQLTEEKYNIINNGMNDFLTTA
jgi:hypothetical protein